MRYPKETNPFYKTKAWRKVRQDALDRDGGICQDCLQMYREGLIHKPNNATMVHHIHPIEECPEEALLLSNLISLCDDCHNKRHPEKGWKPAEKKMPKNVTIHKL